MSIVETKEKMKMIQSVLLEFLEDESNAEENYEKFFKIFTEYQITEDKYIFKAMLVLLSAIGNNHRRVPNFISKLEQILTKIKKDIQNHFSNSEIFLIFKSNKRILLFLFEEKIITIDEYIVLQITSNRFYRKNYTEYFLPEIKPFLTEEFIQKNRSRRRSLNDEGFTDTLKKEIPEEFYDKRKKGENDDYLCELIRTNQVKDFIAFINRSNISPESYIKKSIFETNQLLIGKADISLIEYASFYGSNDIIRFLQINENVMLTQSLWIYAIHSGDAELIKYLEDNQVSPPEDKYETVLKESIKCHHNDVSNYVIEYLIKEEDQKNNIESNYDDNLYRYAIESYNYCFFPENMKCKNIFFYLCEFNYYSLVSLYLAEEKVDINEKIKKINHLNNIFKSKKFMKF